MKNLEKPIYFTIVPTTKCNLECSYCYVNKSNNQNMTLDVIEIIFNKICEISKFLKRNKIIIYWEGGEIFLLSPTWFEKMYDISSNIIKTNNIEFGIRHKLQSNIILYNKNWDYVIKKVFNNVLNTSLDYPNLYRKGKQLNNEEYEGKWIEKKEELLRAGININGVISVINNKTLLLGHEKFFYYYINKIQIKKIKLNILWINKDGNKENIDNISLSKFLTSFFKYWYENGLNEEVIIDPFNFIFSNFKNPHEKSSTCIFAVNCANHFFCIHPDGNVGLCNTVMNYYPELNYGNIIYDSSIDIINNKNRLNFLRRTEYILDSDCNECEYCSQCFGGCFVNSIYAGSCFKDYYCNSYKALFKIAESYTQRK